MERSSSALFRLGAAFALQLTSPLMEQANPVQGPIVRTYAPSPSTQREAGRILRLCRWTDTTSLKDADALLVVVRTGRSEPLSLSYANFKWMRDDAGSLLNESGPQFHVYLYTILPDQSFQQARHRSYDVSDPGIVTDPLGRAAGSGVGGFGCPF